MKMKLKNISGQELKFPKVGITAPDGEFEVPKAMAEILLTNDCIIAVEEKVKRKTKEADDD